MKLYCTTNDKFYGEIGTPTDLVDSLGNTLNIGDIVLLSHNNWHKLRFVAADVDDNDSAYVMGAYLNSIHRKEVQQPFTCKKIADYSLFPNGFSLHDMQYMDISAAQKEGV